MILESLAIFTPAMLAGFGLVQLLWKDQRISALALKLFVGAGLGIGLTSCLYFFRLLAGPGQGGYLMIQIGLLIVVLFALLWQKRIPGRVSLPATTLTPVQILMTVIAVLVTGIALYFLVSAARLAPHGDYDAHAIWNLRARFIYRSGDAWQDAFSPLINRDFHMDYPLLVPLSVVGGWNTLGSEVLRIPTVLSMVALLGMAGTMYCTLVHLRSVSQAALAVILLLATPDLLLYSTFQTADIPLTYYFVASASLLILAHHENDRRLMLLSGLMAGLAAWTKNEGLTFVLLMTGCTLLLFAKQGAYPALLAFLGGTAFPLLTVLLFKTLVSANNDLFADNPISQIVPRLLDGERYARIFTHLLPELGRLGDWPISILVVLLVYGWTMGAAKNLSRAEKAVWLIPLSQLTIYLLIYLITPHDLDWHMNYSMSRLLIHVFPLALFAFFLVFNTPEDVLSQSSIHGA